MKALKTEIILLYSGALKSTKKGNATMQASTDMILSNSMNKDSGPNSLERAVTTFDERHLRNAALIDQERLGCYPVTIVGVGAIGSHLAEMLAKLGVRR